MDSSDVQTNRKGRSSHSNVSVDAEVQRLLRAGNVGNASDLLNKLRMKVNDESLVNKIQKAYVEKHTNLLKKARKFARLVREKYGDRNYPFHILLEKAYVFKVKHALSNDEYSEFQRIYEQELVGLKSPDVYSYANNMVRLLGPPNSSGLGKLSDSDYKYIQEIVKLHASSKVLHSQVFLQSIQYEDSEEVTFRGEFQPNVHNPLDHVHPVIAALFIPKVKSIEDTFILANMSNIVRTRYNNEPFSNVPDTKLYFDLINDPNDVVCDTRSPVIDLLNRCNIQVQLWNSVMSLRLGQYYGKGFREFIAGVDMCRINKFDNPDLVYGRYDGTILKRLLSTFSFRPTIITTMPLAVNAFSSNPYQQNIRPVVTAVPMINVRVPVVPTGTDTGIDLLNAIEQSQAIIENGSMVLKQANLVYSNDVLFFYIDRRSSVIKLNDLRPYNTYKAPSAISGFERINRAKITIPPTMAVREVTFRLRSVVLSEINDTTSDGDIVVGSSALIYKCKGNQIDPNNVLYYSPLAPLKFNDDGGNPGERGAPIQSIDEKDRTELETTQGVIFMYKADESPSDAIIGF